MDRRRFAGALAGVSIIVQACADGGSGPDDLGGSAVGTISLNHGHEAVLTTAQLLNRDGLRLDITGRSTHSHHVDLTGDELRRIRSGERIVRHSSDGFDDKHDHVVTFN